LAAELQFSRAEIRNARRIRSRALSDPEIPRTLDGDDVLERTMDDDEIERELDDLANQLPGPLRADWVVVPKRAIHKAVLVAFLLGAAIALLITGMVLDIESLTWFWPITMFALSIMAKVVPWWREDHSVEQLREAAAQSPSRPAGRNAESR
jgi:hypothetical protein